jgi:hypothetical protein
VKRFLAAMPTLQRWLYLTALVLWPIAAVFFIATGEWLSFGYIVVLLAGSSWAIWRWIQRHPEPGAETH